MILLADERAIERAASALRRGELVAFPTETVYGLGARADDDDAVERIYAAKGRPAENPTIVHASSADEAFELAAEPSDLVLALGAAFWPGPLTLVVPAELARVSAIARAGGETVGLRVPAHPVARALLERAGLPIAAPSANRSTAISPTTAEHVKKSLGASILILDGGPTGFGIESTIVDVAGPIPVVLRRGSISIEALRRVVPSIVDRSEIVVAPGQPSRAPGAMAKHYAPSVPLLLVSASEMGSVESAGTKGFVIRAGTRVPADSMACETLPEDPEGYAQGLYAALHRLEDAGVDAIVVAAPPTEDRWSAILDRLTRASAR